MKASVESYTGFSCTQTYSFFKVKGNSYPHQTVLEQAFFFENPDCKKRERTLAFFKTIFC